MPVREALPRFLRHFAWSPTLGAYLCETEGGRTLAVTLGACTCAAGLHGALCGHSLALLALAEDGAVTDGPLAVAWEIDRLLEQREALMEEITNRAWELAVNGRSWGHMLQENLDGKEPAIEDPVPGEGPSWCAACGRAVLVPEPLVAGWGAFCGDCEMEGLEAQDGMVEEKANTAGTRAAAPRLGG
jgi:hypothetical protein